MSLSRRRSDRPDPARRWVGTEVEALESRQLLSGSPYRFYQPTYSDHPHVTISPNVPVETIAHPIGQSERLLQTLGNEGKSVSGQDRNGTLWTITVHGPGAVIVTDATPTDGVLDDDIATIHLVGTDPNRTYVTGQTTAGAITQNNGTVLFNKLIAENGVKSIVLNGFILTETVNAPNSGLPNSDTGIYLPGGAGTLQFTSVEAFVDQSTQGQPINIVIGDPNVPLHYRPNVRIDELVNTVTDTTATAVSTTPKLAPTINIVINAEANKLQFISASQQAVPAAEQYLFPITGTTGRTSIQAKGINLLRFTGGATNVTASRAAQPFTGAFNSLSHIHTADFGGPADAVALDVKGKIGGLRFTRGAGSPVGLINGPSTYGTPDANLGYPGRGLIGVLVSAGSIGHLKAAPADATLQTSNTQAKIQQHNPGSTTYYVRAGHALNSSAIVTSGSIGSVTVVGDATESEIKTGYSLTSYNQGIQPTRGASRIGRLHYRGDLVDSVISSSFYPGTGGSYSATDAVAGAGRINGHFTGSLYTTGDHTVLTNTGAGFYARSKHGYLPPPQSPTRIFNPGKANNGVLIR